MNRIEKLIEEMCPEGVRQESILAVADYVRGLTYSKSNEDPDGPIGVLRSNNISERSSTLLLDDVKSLAPETKVNDKHRLKRDDVLMSAASGSRKHVGKVAFINEDLEYYFGGFMAVLRSHEGLNPRFLFHILTSYRFSRFLEDTISSTTINTINSSTLKGFMIPLPPLQIQKEIVNILDKFTQLEAELEAELEAREKQYEEVRRRLLDFESDTSNHPLGEMIREMCPEEIKASSLGANCDFVRGSTLDKKDLREYGLPVVHYGEIHTKYGYKSIESISFVEPQKAAKMRKANPGDLVLVTTSEDVEAVAKPMVWLGFEDLNVGGESYIIRSEIDSLFLAHLFMSPQFKKASLRYISGTKVKRISSSNLSKIQIPVPPLEIQKEIVRILDNLDSLVNSVNEGIPAEIAARRKQYEYYRDKLLTFKELDAA